MGETDYEKWIKQREKGMFHYVSRPTIAVMAGILLLRLVWYLIADDKEYFSFKFVVEMVAAFIILVAGWSFDWYRNEKDFREFNKNKSEG